MEITCEIDVAVTAKNLTSLLCAHDKVVQKLTVLDSQIDLINRRLLVQDVQSGQCALYQQQLSVLYGVRQVLDKYRVNKLHQIQTMSRSVIRSLSPDTVTMDMTSTNDHAVTRTIDRAAINYTTLSRECYRYE